MNFKQFLPILEWLPSYNKNTFRADLIAAITVTVLLVPQAMAYALLAGMPPIYGLYGGLFPLLLFGIFGTSRQMSIGPVAVSALLVLAGISQIAEPFTERYITLAILTGFLTGIFQFLLGLTRLGFLANFLSHPILVGFTSAAAVIISVNQLSYLLGFPIPRELSLVEKAQYAFSNLSQTHFLTFILCTSAMVVMLILKKIHKAIPGALIVVVIGILLAKYLQLDQEGIAIIGAVPSGLPSFQFPAWTTDNIRLVFPTVLTVTLIGLVESIGIAKVLEAKTRDHKVEPNQELIAIGIGKMVGGFFQAVPTSASFSRSAVNNQAGAKTGMSSVITAILVAIALLFLTQLFFYLPKAVLAAIILLSVIGLFDYKEAWVLWKTHKGDFVMMLFTFFATLVLGIEFGVLAGVVLSIGMVLLRIATPHIAVLGKIPNTRFYRNVSRFPNAEQLDSVIIFRFDAQLFFGNAQYFKDTIEGIVHEQKDRLEVFILNAFSMTSMDSTGLNALEEIHQFLEKNDIELYITGVRGPVRDLFHRSGFMDTIGKENQFMDVHQAVEYCKNKEAFKGRKFQDVLQTNVEEEED